MKREIKLYKVVIKNQGKMFSINTAPDASCCLDYFLNKTTRPCYGKIFCFDSIENAKFFVVQLGIKGIILEGIGTNPSKPKMVCGFRCDIRKFWTLKSMKKGVSIISSHPPEGTVWVDSFKPTKVC